MCEGGNGDGGEGGIFRSVFLASPRSLLPVMFVYRKRVQRDCQVAGKGEEGDKPFLLFLLLSRDLFLTFLLSDLVPLPFLLVRLFPGPFLFLLGLAHFGFSFFFVFLVCWTRVLFLCYKKRK